MSPAMRDSFKTRADSPYPFRLQDPPRPYDRRARRRQRNAINISHEDQDGQKQSILSRYIEVLFQLGTGFMLRNVLTGLMAWFLLVDGLVLQAAQNLSLSLVAATRNTIRATRMSWIWWTWRGNYRWLVTRVFGLSRSNSDTTLITNIINICASRSWFRCVGYLILVAIARTCVASIFIVLLVYHSWILNKAERLRM